MDGRVKPGHDELRFYGASRAYAAACSRGW